MNIIRKKDGAEACRKTYEYILGVKGRLTLLRNKDVIWDNFTSAKYLQMFTTYLLYNGETERLKLEFENFNKDYFKLNKMMNKSEDTKGNGDGDDELYI